MKIFIYLQIDIIIGYKCSFLKKSYNLICNIKSKHYEKKFTNPDVSSSI